MKMLLLLSATTCFLATHSCLALSEESELNPSSRAEDSHYLNGNNVAEIVQYSDAERFFHKCLKVREVHFKSTAAEDLRPPTVTSARVHDINDPVITKCTTYACLTRHFDRDLRHLDKMRCRMDVDCAPNISKMKCRDFGSSGSYCDCPRYSAYNATSCKCEPAQICGYTVPGSVTKEMEETASSSCHKGMKCTDNKCSCRSLEDQLFEPHGRFCVEPSETTFQMLERGDSNMDTNGFLIAIIILSSVLTVGLLAFFLYAVSQNFKGLCDRGQYVCDDNRRKMSSRILRGRGRKVSPQGEPQQGVYDEDQGVVHVAAWDMPGLDYLSEEQTLKYLNRGNQNRAYTEDDTSAVVATGSDSSNPIPLRRSGAQENINQATNGSAASPTSSPSPSTSAGSSLPESERFDVGGNDENTMRNSSVVQMTPAGNIGKHTTGDGVTNGSRWLEDHEHPHPMSAATPYRQSLQSLTMHSNIL